MNTKPTYQDLENQIAELRKQNEKLEMANREIIEYNRFFLFSSDMMCISTEEHLVKINPTFTNVLGYDEKDLLDNPFLFFVHPDDVQTTLDEVAKLKQGIAISHFVNRWRCKDNSYRWLDWTTSPDTQIGLIYAVARDITERKQAQEALLRSEAETRQNLREIEQIYAYSPIGLFVFDSEYRFTRINERMAEINGFPVAHHIGKTLEDIVPELATLLKEAYRPIFDRGEPVLNVEIHGKTPKDQNTERDWIGNYFPLKSENDKVIGLIGTVLEITERKLAEEALKESERLARIIADNIPSMLGYWNRDMICTFANKQYLNWFNRTPEQMIGIRMQDLMGEELFKKNEPYALAALRGTFQQFERTLTKPNGEIRHTWAQYIPNQIDEEVQGFFVMVTDITEVKQAGQKLSIAAEQLRAAQKLAKIGSWETDLTNFAVSWSEQTYSIFELNTESFKASHQAFLEFVHPDDRAKVDSAFVDSLNKDLDNKIEHRIVTSSGNVKYIEECWKVTKDAEGKPERVLGSCQDITDRKQAQEDLMKSLKDVSDYKYALDTSSIVAITDQKGIITYANDNFCKISKYSSKELIGQSHQIINSGFHPKEFIRDLWVTIASGKVWKGELKNKAKDGTIYWVDTTIVPFVNEQGKPYQYLAIRDDITENKKAEEKLIQTKKLAEKQADELIQSEKRLNVAQSIAKIGSWEFDLQTFNLTWSREHYRIFELEETPADKLYEAYRNKIHPEDIPELDRVVNLAIEKGLGFEYEHRVLCKDGSIKNVLGIGKTVTDANGKTVAVHGTVQDITERKQSELQKEKMTNDLIQRNKALEQFSYILSHNLRSPLSTIIGLTEMLQDKDLQEEDREYINESLATSAMRLDETFRDINQILDVRQSIVDKKELVHFTKLTSNILINIEAIVAKKNAVVTWDFSQVDEMLAVKSYIYSIFYNLISNSLKYSQQDVPPRVEISSEIVNNKIILHFKDNGIGIDLEKQGNKIFGLYKRFHHGHAEGKGIGLFMVKTQVETIGGRVSVSSEVNKGSKFSLEFPI